MKKILLSFFCSAATLLLSAQNIVYFEDFENASAATYTNATTATAVTGLTGWTFESTTAQGRLRTSAGGTYTLSGSRAMTIDAASITSPDPQNSLILTYDMSSFTVASSPIELRFWVMDHGEETDIHDRVWVRGSNVDPWVQVVNFDPFFSFPGNNPSGQYFEFVVDVQTALDGAGQEFSSTFGVRFGQMDNFPSTSITASDGLTFDDVSILENVLSVNFVNGNFEPCFNDTNGFLTAEGTFGVAPFTYAWNTGATTATITGLGAGTYTVTATDVNGDTVSNSTTLTATDSIFADQINLNQLICKYDDASVQINGSGGSAYNSIYSMDTNSFNFMWDSASNCNSQVFGGNNQVSAALPIGFDFEFYGNTYDEFQMASNGFIGFGGGLDNGCCDGDPIPNTSTFEPRNSIYAIWGGMDASAAAYSYCLEGDAPFRRLVVNFEDIKDCCTGVNPNGTAQIIIYETSNCIEIQTDYWDPINVSTFDEQNQGIQNETGTEAQTYPGLNGVNWPAIDDNYIKFCPLDSTGLLYEWSDGYFGRVNEGLSAGTYTVSVTDALGCVLEEEVVINPAPSTLTLDPIVSDVSCFGLGDGSILSNQTGGVAPIVYSWSSGQTSADINNVGGGSYDVYATDNLGCEDSVLNIVLDEPTLLVSAINGQTSPVCPDDPTGSANVVASGGRVPYTYTWSDGQLGTTATGLTEGVYLVTVTDSSGCQSIQSLSLDAQNEAPQVDLGVNYQSVNGIGVTLDAGAYAQYLWSTGETTQTIHVGQTGTYWAQATNAAGCSGSDTVYVEIWPNGINGEDGSSIMTLFPNPTTDRLTLDLQGGSTLKDVTVTVTDIQGRTILQDAFMTIEPNAPVSIDVNALTPGTYNLSVRSDNVNIVRAFVKQ
jgi:uncharacterized protein (DUF2141 family)